MSHGRIVWGARVAVLGWTSNALVIEPPTAHGMVSVAYMGPLGRPLEARLPIGCLTFIAPPLPRPPWR